MKYIFIIFTLFLFACSTNREKYFSQATSDTTLINKLKALTHQANADKLFVIFKLDSLTSYKWDTVLILTPYIPIDNLEKKYSFDLSGINRNFINNDGLNTLAFITNKKLTHYTYLPRDNGDFEQFDSIRYYTPETAKFKMVKTGRRFTGGDNIIEVIPLQTIGTFLEWRVDNKKEK